MMLEQKGIVPRAVYTFDGRDFSKTEVDIIREIPLQVFLNEQPLATIACTGLHVDELAVGYLASEGLIQKSADIPKYFARRKAVLGGHSPPSIDKIIHALIGDMDSVGQLPLCQSHWIREFCKKHFTRMGGGA